MDTKEISSIKKVEDLENKLLEDKVESKLFEYFEKSIPFIVPLILTTFTYFFGWIYVGAYFSYFGINFDSLNLPTVYIFRKSIFTFFIFLSSFSLFNLIDRIINRTLGNIIICIYLLFSILLIFDFDFLPNFIANNKNILLYLLQVIFWIFSLSKAYVKFGIRGIITFIWMLYFATHSLANLQAELLLHRKIYHVFIKNESSLNDISNKELIFLIKTNDSYYFFDNKQLKTPHPEIYIVPKSKIDYLKIMK